ncbi:MAG: 3-deoxy-D-manno-octulosonic acid transferase [Desulfomonilia bacterium]|jgi:3-deoxy-D-manno-octulosonic-acid transferase
MILIYRLLGSIAVWPLAFFLRRHPNFKGTLLQRLGLRLPEVPAGKKTLWIHAASVGEVKAVSGLVGALKASRPDLFICMSCMTATGRKMAEATEGMNMVFAVPFDVPWAMRRHLLKIMPEAVLIVETEIWPNLILSAQKCAVRVIFVNARMSVRAYKRYRRFAGVFGHILADVKVFAMAEDDAARFRSIGASEVQVLGNLKLAQVALGDKTRRDALRRELGITDRPVFIAGSVREGEEKEVVDAIIRIASRVRGLYAIIAPRHPDRIQYIKDMAQGLNIKWGLRSAGGTDVDLLIVDTFGELFILYGLSDAAFVGGSLVDLGGQNILEPIAWGVPTIHGPHMDNFTWALDIVQDFTVVVRNAQELANAAVAIFEKKQGMEEIGLRAREAFEKFRGVTDRYLDALDPLL